MAAVDCASSPEILAFVAPRCASLVCLCFCVWLCDIASSLPCVCCSKVALHCIAP
jgi:hypothetical protein